MAPNPFLQPIHITRLDVLKKTKTIGTSNVKFSNLVSSEARYINIEKNRYAKLLLIHFTQNKD